MDRRAVACGIHVVTNNNLSEDSALFIHPRHEHARSESCSGIVTGNIPGTCGEGWWVRHNHGTGGYWFHEFEEL